MKRIESRDNKWIKRLNGLKIKKNRDKEGLFIAEGLRFIREIPKNWEVLAYAVSDAFAAENDLSPYEEKAEVLCLTDALFAAVCDTENPQGILAVCKKLDWDADAVLAKYKDWHDVTEWPTSGRTLKKRESLLKKQEDPITKKGTVGDFCRTYTVEEAMERFLPGVYTACAVEGIVL